MLYTFLCCVGYCCCTRFVGRADRYSKFFYGSRDKFFRFFSHCVPNGFSRKFWYRGTMSLTMWYFQTQPRIGDWAGINRNGSVRILKMRHAFWLRIKSSLHHRQSPFVNVAVLVEVLSPVFISLTLFGKLFHLPWWCFLVQKWPDSHSERTLVFFWSARYDAAWRGRWNRVTVGAYFSTTACQGGMTRKVLRWEFSSTRIHHRRFRIERPWLAGLPNIGSPKLSNVDCDALAWHRSRR